MIVDLSHAVDNGMTVFPGDPEPRFDDAGAADPWRVTVLRMGSHTGTHIDAASHCIPGGATIDAYSLERFIVSGVVVPAFSLKADEPIEWTQIAPWLTAPPSIATARHPDATSTQAVALHTGWDARWGSDQYLSHPYLSDEAARRLVAAGIGLVAIDALNVDSTARGRATVHQILLGADVLVVENLRGLDQLEPGRAYRFAFLPLRLSGLDGSPVRAVAWEA